MYLVVCVLSISCNIVFHFHVSFVSEHLVPWSDSEDSDAFSRLIVLRSLICMSSNVKMHIQLDAHAIVTDITATCG